MILSGSRLTGGLSGTTPQISFFETRAYSPNVIFNPVDERFLFMTSNSTNVIVTVNSLKSVCLTNCVYTFLTSTPTVSAQTLSGSTVQISLTNPLSTSYTTAMLKVKVDGQVC